MTTSQGDTGSKSVGGLEVKLSMGLDRKSCDLMPERVADVIREAGAEVPLVEIDVWDDLQRGSDNDITTPTLLIARDGAEISRIKGVSSLTSPRKLLSEVSPVERRKSPADTNRNWISALRLAVTTLAVVLLIAGCSIRAARQQLLEASVLSLPSYHQLWGWEIESVRNR